MDFDYSRWNARLQELCRLHGVPGATLAVGTGGEVHEVAVGVLDRATGAPMRNDSMFQIGSITKVYTATAVMQLVAQGAVDLDTRVCDVLPDFRVADPETTRNLTVRHLLSHTSGLENGVFPDVGSDDDCLERYVASCADLGQLHPLGALGAYSHAGFLIAGRLVEHLSGRVWEAAVRELLLDPLGLHDTVTRPDLADPARRVPGHRLPSPGHSTPAPGTATTAATPPPPPAPLRWDTPRIMGPGSGFCATAGDMVRFAMAHMSDSTSPSTSTGALPPGAAKAMREPQAPMPCAWGGGHRGIGWRLYPGKTGDDISTYGHGGELPGLLTYLYAVESPQLAIALCSNGGDNMALRSDVRDDLAALAGATVRRFEAPETPADIDIEPFLGTYRCSPAEARLERDESGIWLRPRFVGGGTSGTLMPRETRLVPVTDTLLAGFECDGRYPIPVTLHVLPDGSRYIYARERTLRKVS
ncbi:serine hydrolase domain-containing protein [Yinghuangia sp. YIM S09857]|uniref:serine hydrolase domain-containing protein n=1 Tax=Yinghuangia sp. YIM S09857 TaxID=3436929 RepID=UPI003F52C918